MNKELLLKKYNLQEHPCITLLEYGDEKDWLELRKKGVGGSDVGAIMGLNEYRSILQVYKDKVGESKEVVDNVYVRKGKDLEELIRNYYVVPELAKQGYKVLPVKHTLINEAYPWLRANIDGIAIPEGGNYEKNIVIEIKWVSEWGAQKWGGDLYKGIPPSYYAQVQEYLAITGARMAIVCALFDSNWEMKYYKISRDEVFITSLLKQTKQFMDLNVGMRIPPKVDAELDKIYIAEEVSKPMEKEPVPDRSMDDDIFKYKSVNLQIKALEKDAEALKNLITNKYLEGHRPTLSTNKVSISSYTTRRFDSTAFKEDHPEVYANYVKETTAVKTTIK